MGYPEKNHNCAAGDKRQYFAGKILNVELLGFPGKVQWRRDETGLKVRCRPKNRAITPSTLKIEGLELQVKLIMKRKYT